MTSKKRAKRNHSVTVAADPASALADSLSDLIVFGDPICDPISPAYKKEYEDDYLLRHDDIDNIVTPSSGEFKGLTTGCLLLDVISNCVLAVESLAFVMMNTPAHGHVQAEITTRIIPIEEAINGDIYKIRDTEGPSGPHFALTDAEFRSRLCPVAFGSGLLDSGRLSPIAESNAVGTFNKWKFGRKVVRDAEIAKLHDRPAPLENASSDQLEVAGSW